MQPLEGDEGMKCECICYCECSRVAHIYGTHMSDSLPTEDDAGNRHAPVECYCTEFELYDEDDADFCPVHDLGPVPE